MPELTPGSWQPDPFGRFAQRYWDGTSWTENVSDASGAQTTDPPVASATQSVAASSPSGSALPVPALVVVGVGALLVVLSDFALTWFSSGIDAKLSDLRDFAGESDDVPFFVDQYLSWGWLVGLAVVGLAVLAVFNPRVRVWALAAAVVMAVWHGWTVYDTGSDRISPEIGAWLGAVGFAACAVALLLPRPANAGR